PVDGLRALSSADQLAAFEWAAARASRAVASIVAAAEPGAGEHEVLARMGYAGEPLSAHVMFASGLDLTTGLRSATGRLLDLGDPVTTAVGFWGGLCCRAGLLAPADARSDYLDRVAAPYWRAIATWYETVRIGATGGEIDAAVRGSLAGREFGSALNP